MPKGKAPPILTPSKEDQLEEAHQLLLEIKQAQFQDMTLFQGVEVRFTLMAQYRQSLCENWALHSRGCKAISNLLRFEFQYCKYLVKASKE
ncbi:hypothetical protein JCGZ_25165 [Jatropha curcas]|uniref:Uncharacterized protein n=1 Tax=Jatropha curcas TaxID=180498 RepID=A0A067JZA3_JATCU|nr:hypothetical protein JCGZ_25165 [Jatropha curcas]